MLVDILLLVVLCAVDVWLARVLIRAWKAAR